MVTILSVQNMKHIKKINVNAIILTAYIFEVKINKGISKTLSEIEDPLP